MLKSFKMNILFILVLMLVPVMTNASNISGNGSQDATPGIQDAASPAPTISPLQDLKYTDVVPGDGNMTTQGDPNQATQSNKTDSKSQIKIVYDPETESTHKTQIALIIAFGISLVLNIYLATSLLAARRKL